MSPIYFLFAANLDSRSTHRGNDRLIYILRPFKKRLFSWGEFQTFCPISPYSYLERAFLGGFSFLPCPQIDCYQAIVNFSNPSSYICASCVKHYELDKAELIANTEVKPGAFLAEMLLERQGLTFWPFFSCV
jgi:hypothetical protein